MAERAIPTALLFQTASKFFKGDGPGPFTHLALCGESMAGFDVDTTDFADEITRESVSPSLTTVTKTDDAVVMTKSAWAPGVDEIFGAGIATGLADATIQVFHEWATSITFEASDTVTQTITVQSKEGA